LTWFHSASDVFTNKGTNWSCTEVLGSESKNFVGERMVGGYVSYHTTVSNGENE
jgi:hypothetical protein